MRKLAGLSEEDTRSLEIITNKIACAGQALRPDAVPAYAPKPAADKFFREAIFALADARYLRESFWRDVGNMEWMRGTGGGCMRILAGRNCC